MLKRKDTNPPTGDNTEEKVTQTPQSPPVPLLKQLLADKFLGVTLRSYADEKGITHKAEWEMFNQSGRGQQKKSIPIHFCPVTGFNLENVTVSEGTDGNIIIK